MEQTIDISDSAASRISFLATQEAGKAFRVSVDGGGCSGFKYKFDFSDTAPDDIVFEKNGAKVVTDATSLEFLKGSVVDYIEQLDGAYFAMKNPNAKSSCGCGSSFAV